MARLTSKSRSALPKSAFALPKAADASPKPGKGAYPIPDAGHARAALSRVKQFGTPAMQATVKAKVAQKFPSMEVGGKSPKSPKAPKPPRAKRGEGMSHDQILNLGSGKWK